VFCDVAESTVQFLAIVPNGLALCKLHHAAFDSHVLGIRPDLTVEIRVDVLEEADGPMLKHGLQDFQGARLVLPRHSSLHPNPEFLAERYRIYRKAV
jgi:putative restriction endonuclease